MSGKVKHAYLVTAQFLIAEQTSIWARVGGFVALVAIFKESLHSILAICMKMIVLIILWLSLERSFGFRNCFVALMRKQEERLGLIDCGPMTKGEQLSNAYSLGNQRSTFRLFVFILALCFVFEFVGTFSSLSSNCKSELLNLLFRHSP